jgi:hypothetical protein
MNIIEKQGDGYSVQIVHPFSTSLNKHTSIR